MAKRTALPLAQWPHHLQVLAATLVPSYRLAVGRLLAYCRDHDNCDVTADSVRDFLSDRARLIASSSLVAEKVALRYGLPVLFADQDWQWLIDAASRQTGSGKPRSSKPLTVSVSPEDWPLPCRQVWGGAPQSSSTGSSRFKVIAAQTDQPVVLTKSVRETIRKGYGQYLYYCRHNDRGDAICPVSVQTYIDHLRDRDCRPRTVASYIEGLARLAPQAYPDQDWTWLQQTAKVLTSDAVQGPKLKHAKPMPHPIDIWMHGLDLIKAARQEPHHFISTAAKFRDGLLLVSVIALPLRLSNIAGMAIGKTLLLPDSGPARLNFPGSEMKNQRPYHAALWDEVRFLIDEYIKKWRPLLARGYGGPELWLTGMGTLGRPLQGPGIYKIITGHTKQAFGEAINPHLLRDIVATAMVEAHPERPQEASDLLQHHSSMSRAEYTSLANMVTACKIAQAANQAVQQQAQRSVLGKK